MDRVDCLLLPSCVSIEKLWLQENIARDKITLAGEISGELLRCVSVKQN